MKKILEFYRKRREIIHYLIVGGATTVISYVGFFVASYGLKLSTGVSSVLADGVAIVFAYIASKLFVFDHKTHGALELAKEAGGFLASRLLTLLLNAGFMIVTVDKLHLNDIAMRLIANIFVIVLNYILSKFFVFRDGKSE